MERHHSKPSLTPELNFYLEVIPSLYQFSTLVNVNKRRNATLFAVIMGCESIDKTTKMINKNNSGLILDCLTGV